MPVELEESTWPVVTLRIRGALTEDEEDYFVETSVGLPRRRERYAAIIHLLDAATPTARFIRAQAAAQRQRRSELEAYCVGIAFVINSAMLRGALRAILYLQSLPCAYVVVDTVGAAEAWAEAQVTR